MTNKIANFSFLLFLVSAVIGFAKAHSTGVNTTKSALRLQGYFRYALNCTTLLFAHRGEAKTGLPEENCLKINIKMNKQL